MISKWTQHLKNDKERERFEQSLRSSSILDRLRDIITEMEQAAALEEVTTKTYDSPNWDYRQADRNGFKRCLYMFRKLTTLDQERTSE